MQKRIPEGTPPPPAQWMYRIGPHLVGPYLRRRMDLRIHLDDIEADKGPWVILGNHAAVIDPLVLAYALQHIPVNFVGGYDLFRVPGLRWLLRQLGAIRKFQYHTDLASLRAMSGVIQRGGRLGLFPTGRLSTVGEGRSVTIALAKLIKRWGVPVYGATLDGTYFIKPKWAKFRRYGPVEVHVRRLLTVEEIKSMSPEEMVGILNTITEFDAYRDGDSNKLYQGPCMAEGLETILYRCPVCQYEYELSTHENELKCEHCSTVWHLQSNGRFAPGEQPVSPYDWVAMQKQHLYEQMVEKPLLFQAVAIHRKTDLRVMKKYPPVEGLLTMTSTELRFDVEQQEPLIFSLLNLDSLPYRAGVNIEIASDTAVHTFTFDMGKQAIKWSFAAEVLATIRQEKNNLNG